MNFGIDFQLKPCAVCGLLDNDFREKLCSYCPLCDAWICKADIPDLVRRAVAMYKRKKKKLWSQFEKFKHLKFMGYDDDGFAEIMESSFGVPLISPPGSLPTTVTFNTTHVIGDNSSVASLELPFTNVGLVIGNAFILGVTFAGVVATVLTVCDGTGAGQCTGGSTWHSQGLLRNSTNSMQIWYTCSYQGVTANGLTITTSGTVGYIYGAGIAATGNTQAGTGCLDQYKDNSGTSGTAYSTGAMTSTTNAHDLLVSFAFNDAGGTYTAGTDGQGNTMTIQANDAGVAAVSSFNETITAAFNSNITGPSTHWEMAEFAVK